MKTRAAGSGTNDLWRVFTEGFANEQPFGGGAAKEYGDAPTVATVANFA